MKSICTLLLALLISCIAKAQSFPADFVGHWKGEIEWFQQGKKEPQKSQMQLRIQPADTAGQYAWQIIYGEAEKDNRPYLLNPVDTTKGHWIIDERNAIILDQYWVGNKLGGVFSVASSTIFNSYWIENGKLFVEFVTMKARPLSRTGNGTEDSPHVDSYQVRSRQYGVLQRIR